jgi:hypothetical protein
VPAPETAGLNVFEETPVPLNTPPAGNPDKVTGLLAVVNAGYVPALTVGKGLTDNTSVAVESQPATLDVLNV